MRRKKQFGNVPREILETIAHLETVVAESGQANYAQALLALDRLADIYGKYSLSEHLARSLKNKGALLYRTGSSDEAYEFYSRALEIQERIGDEAGRAMTLAEIGQIHSIRAEYDAARDCLQRAYDIMKSQNDLQGMARTTHHLASILGNLGEEDQAYQLFESAIAHEERVGGSEVRGASLYELGRIHANRGEIARAKSLYQDSLRISRDSGDEQGTAKALHYMGMLHVKAGELDKALLRYNESIDIDDVIGDVQGKGATLNKIAEVYTLKNQLDDALDTYLGSCDTMLLCNDVRGLGNTYHRIAEIYESLERYTEAIQYYQRSMEIRDKIGLVYQVADSAERIVRLWAYKLEDPNGAKDYLVRCIPLIENVASPAAEGLRRLLSDLKKKPVGSEFIQSRRKEFDIGSYLIENLKVIGIMRGTMGVVYLLENTARQNVTNPQFLCAKTFTAEWLGTDYAKRRFFEEAENWLRLGRYEHIVAAYDYRSVDGVPYVLMQYANSGTLIDKRKTGFDPLSSQEDYLWALVYIFGIALGLKRIYQRVGLPHGDLRPVNILFGQGGHLVKISDFGLMSAVRASDPRAESQDILQFGKIIWLLLTGREDGRNEITNTVNNFSQLDVSIRNLVRTAVIGTGGGAADFFSHAADIANDVLYKIGGRRLPTPEEHLEEHWKLHSEEMDRDLADQGLKSLSTSLITGDAPGSYVNRALSLSELGNKEEAYQEILKALGVLRLLKDTVEAKQAWNGLRAILAGIVDLEERRALFMNALELWESPVEGHVDLSQEKE